MFQHQIHQSCSFQNCFENYLISLIHSFHFHHRFQLLH
uniref:Uncharacterized protein n=1 Tax=Arcella intermedia TaxID=1963864 RepID=A0A6B2LTQ1_9EUKA